MAESGLPFLWLIEMVDKRVLGIYRTEKVRKLTYLLVKYLSPLLFSRALCTEWADCKFTSGRTDLCYKAGTSSESQWSKTTCSAHSACSVHATCPAHDSTCPHPPSRAQTDGAAAIWVISICQGGSQDCGWGEGAEENLEKSSYTSF